MEAFQDRVVEEKEALDVKVAALAEFRMGEAFGALDPAEKWRLTRQLVVMQDYSAILDDRIHAFTGPGV